MRGLRLLFASTLVAAMFSGCDRVNSCPSCGAVVISAVGEPPSIFPPLAVETVGRDIGDLIFERLADLQPGRPTIDEAAYTPGLASRWERLDSLTWRFTL